MHLLEGVGGDLVVEGVEHGGALLGRELVHEVGDVGGVEELELGARHGEADRAVVGLLEVDVAPVDQPRAAASAAPWSSRSLTRDEPDAAQDRAARHVDGRDVHVLAGAHELDVVDADDLAALGVDELLVEEGVREQQLVARELARLRGRRPARRSRVPDSSKLATASQGANTSLPRRLTASAVTRGYAGRVLTTTSCRLPAALSSTSLTGCRAAC